LGSLSVFYPVFIGPTPETANTSRVADHIEYIANIVGRNHVGIGSDFDGIYSSVIGLEDASKYPNLVSTSMSNYFMGFPD
jgi:membrane dipeptidase